MFYGRKQELRQMEQLYAEGKFQLFILYGRRRIGKTALLKEFCRNKPTIFYSAEISNDKLNLDKFSIQIAQYYQETEISVQSQIL